MNRRILIIVSCALLLSASASYLVYRAAVARGVPVKPRTTDVIVASRDLIVGTLIQENDLKMAAWFGPPPAGASRKLASFLNRGVISPIYEGEPATENRLAATGSGGGLAAMIPRGMRACAVKVNEVVGVAGFVIPGMRVDVLITGLPPGSSAAEGAKVRTLLQNIQVLSAGVNFKQDHEGKPEQAQVVNLLVTPTQAEILSLASNETHIQLVLRNPMDTQISQPPGTILSSLYGDAPAVAQIRAPRPARVPPIANWAASPPAAPAPPAPYTIEVTNGAVHSQARFSQPAGKQ